MKTKLEIMNAYAVEQGFNNWYDFAINYKSKGYSTYSFLEHQNKVIDLIQDELLCRASEIAVSEFLKRNINWGDLRRAVLNTEIL